MDSEQSMASPAAPGSYQQGSGATESQEFVTPDVAPPGGEPVGRVVSPKKSLLVRARSLARKVDLQGVSSLADAVKNSPLDDLLDTNGDGKMFDKLTVALALRAPASDKTWARWAGVVWLLLVLLMMFAAPSNLLWVSLSGPGTPAYLQLFVALLPSLAPIMALVFGRLRVLSSGPDYFAIKRDAEAAGVRVNIFEGVFVLIGLIAMLMVLSLYVTQLAWTEELFIAAYSLGTLALPASIFSLLLVEWLGICVFSYMRMRRVYYRILESDVAELVIDDLVVEHRLLVVSVEKLCEKWQKWLIPTIVVYALGLFFFNVNPIELDGRLADVAPAANAVILVLLVTPMALLNSGLEYLSRVSSMLRGIPGRTDADTLIQYCLSYTQLSTTSGANILGFKINYQIVYYVAYALLIFGLFSI